MHCFKPQIAFLPLAAFYGRRQYDEKCSDHAIISVGVNCKRLEMAIREVLETQVNSILFCLFIMIELPIILLRAYKKQ